ncbi:PaaX family transcriptional regulator C-terminal domain-containing protein [Paracoccus aminophilus]|uniref:Phenylacetic acid degradation operon negative regulatory protein PaaX n=1 Tax=Paracoccus aminophilus JCM 7686 TaxID=1367847 RepID=S5XLX5_PARAH|nr:PaaX family transcriptional regulator C-terminal domain-containing protein [Paracoccus aminophilus]AGT08264.1 phenylacetic acid degradation operon negative regulatory protein PaaX [Paracoccus aminophilus JCM 7686]
MTPSAHLPALLDTLSLRATSFIVTVYGDVVVPRGEVLWMGNLIEICARVGISESLVRTAVSRLVQAGQLAGERVGRRSYYRLAPTARAEFSQVAKLLYRPLPEAKGWLILQAPDLPDELLRRLRLGRLEGNVLIAPDHGQTPPKAALALHAALGASDPSLAACWDLPPLQAAYAEMIARFAPLAKALTTGEQISAEEALIARLLLVECYRKPLLRDPRLPATALPSTWSGHDAHRLFAQLYRQLSGPAERYIGQNLEGESGFLPATSAISNARLTDLD